MRPGHSVGRLDFVLKTGTFVFLFVVMAKVLNFFKKILIGNLFGISWQADSFFAASYLPYYIAVFFEGVIYLGLIPLFSRVLSEEGEEGGARFVGEILPWVMFLTAVIALGASIGSPWLVREIVPGFRAESQVLTRNLLCIMSLVIIFITLSSFFQALNSYFGNYLIAASSGLTDSFVMIGTTILTFRIWGIYGAAWGAVAGAVMAFALQVFLLKRSRKIFPVKFFVGPAPFLKLLKILIPLGIIWAFQMMPLVILNRFGSGMWQGTISSITISLGIMIVPTGLVSQTVIISVFPSLAKAASEMTGENVRETFFQTLRAAFFILIPAGFLLSGFAGPIAALFFGGGGEITEGTRRISNSLYYLGWAAFVFYADLFMTQSLITIRKTRAAICLCATRAILTYVFCYLLSWIWDYQGLALSFSLGLAVNFFILFPLLFKMTPLKGQWLNLFHYSLKLLMAACPLLFFHLILKSGLVGFGSHWPKVQIFFGATFFALAGLLFYFFALYCFRVKELQSVFETLKRIGAQKKWWIANAGDA